MSGKKVMYSILLFIFAGFSLLCIVDYYMGHRYVDEYGNGYRYKTYLVIESDTERLTYPVYTNKKDAVYTEEDMYNLMDASDYPNGCWFEANNFKLEKKKIDEGQFQIDDAYYTTNAGVGMTKEEFFKLVLHNEFWKIQEISSRDYLDKMIAEQIGDEQMFDFEQDKKILEKQEGFKEEGFLYNDKELQGVTPRFSYVEGVCSLTEEDAVKRAEKEMGKAYDVAKIRLDAEKQIYRVGFYKKGEENCYVYMGLDGLTKCMAYTDEYLDSDVWLKALNLDYQYKEEDKDYDI